jgi:paired amphipathic helix protein Sin3a
LQNPTTQKTLVQLLTAEDSTFENEELSQEARWSYYVSAYTMRDPTEGVSFSQMRMPFLKRSLPGKLEQDEEYNRYYRRLIHHDGLIIRICANSYHILYEPGSYDWWWRPTAVSQEESEENVKELGVVKERRQDRFREKFINNPGWAHGLSKDEVDASNQKFRAWVKDPNASNAPNAPEDVEMDTAVGAAGADAKPETKAPSDEPATTTNGKENEQDADMVDATEPGTTKTEEE